MYPHPELARIGAHVEGRTGFRDAPENKGNIPTFSHEDLHAEMSRKQDGLGGQTLRDSLREKSVEDQLEAMFKLMKKLGILK